jgi:hypothetical protein
MTYATMKVIFYFHDESLKILRAEVREYQGNFDQEYMLINMNPEKPWLNYASRRLTEAQFIRELKFLSDRK